MIGNFHRGGSSLTQERFIAWLAVSTAPAASQLAYLRARVFGKQGYLRRHLSQFLHRFSECCDK